MAISTLDLMPLVAAILHVISFDLLGGFIWRVCWPLIYRTIYSSWKLESSALMRIWFESSALSCSYCIVYRHCLATRLHGPFQKLRLSSRLNGSQVPNLDDLISSDTI